jgi:hypothetical protein
MKLVTVLPVLAVVGVGVACGKAPADRSTQVAIVCEAELKDAMGVVVASIEDTVTVEASRDTVGTDPRPCKSGYQMGQASLTLNAKTAGDTVTGSPTD